MFGFHPITGRGNPRTLAPRAQFVGGLAGRPHSGSRYPLAVSPDNGAPTGTPALKETGFSACVGRAAPPGPGVTLRGSERWAPARRFETLAPRDPTACPDQPGREQRMARRENG